MSLLDDMQIEAISFDIWATLLGGNIKFTVPRLRLIFDELQLPWVGDDEVFNAYRSAQDTFDKRMEVELIDYGINFRLREICRLLGIDESVVPSARDLEPLQAKIGQLRLNPDYMPPLLEADLCDTLCVLRARGLKLGVLSNTGMDSEAAMVPLLEAHGIWQLLDVHLFSNSHGLAKPHLTLFVHMAEKFGCPPERVLHIGDNRVADYSASKAGLQVLLYAPKGDDNYRSIRSMKDLL